MSALREIIKAQIRRTGPMSIADYMALCLLHPAHGYYTTRLPLGAEGDFTTAPEISQMFGEMLGLWLIQSWREQGSPARFVLAEPGPGRGTLMADILRVARKLPDFAEAAEIWLIEASPTLRQEQAHRLSGHDIHHATAIDALPEGPLFLVANEFFDALPIRQYIRTPGGWRERMVGLRAGELVLGLSPELPVGRLDGIHAGTPTGEMVEVNVSACEIVAEIARRINAHGGAALVIDYGSNGSRGDSFQAVRSHEKANPLHAPGEADLTAHVDFAALARAARQAADGLRVSGPLKQGVFLERLGITARAAALARRMQGKALDNHVAAHRRLTHPDEMGSLFKVLALTPGAAPLPAGFDANDP